MQILFWFSLLTVSYVYIGYAALLAVYAQLRGKPFLTGADLPTVSIIMAAHNEEKRLPAKLANLSVLLYPSQQLEIVAVSDGSTDRTVEILREYAAKQAAVPLHLVILPRAMGKAAALNEAVRRAQGEILVFLDVRQSVELNAVAELVSCFADPGVGAVSGELLLESARGSNNDGGLGIYWKIEKMVRKLESQTGSVVGVTGAIYAMRRDCYVDIPTGTILDDVFVPMNIVRMGKRVVFQPAAIARDCIFDQKGKEFGRKVRTLTGNYQLLQLAPWLLTPANPLLFRLVSHKLLRLAVPFLLLTMLVASAIVGGTLYRVALLLQLIFYGLAALGALNASAKSFKPVAVAYTFVMLNVAAAVALYNFVAGRKDVWV